MRSHTHLAFLVVVALGSATSVGAEKHLAELDQSKAFLTAHCVSCHGNEKSKGDHNFEMFNGKDWANHELLNELLTVLKEKEMQANLFLLLVQRKTCEKYQYID